MIGNGELGSFVHDVDIMKCRLLDMTRQHFFQRKRCATKKGRSAAFTQLSSPLPVLHLSLLAEIIPLAANAQKPGSSAVKEGR
jgi:hypothetical protein